jgi:hypothetical protein
VRSSLSFLSARVALSASTFLPTPRISRH